MKAFLVSKELALGIYCLMVLSGMLIEKLKKKKCKNAVLIDVKIIFSNQK